jgi:hypothetical protein
MNTMNAEILGLGFGSIIVCYSSWRWIIALAPGEKLNRQLNVGLAVTTSSIQFFNVIVCLTYAAFPEVNRT